MTKSVLLILSTILLSSGAFASHSISCKVEATVISVSGLTRLNGTSVYSQDEKRVKTDHEQVAVVRINKIVSVDGSTPSCLPLASEHSVLVQTEDLDALAQGEKVTLRYSNQGDRVGSAVSWNLL